MPVVAVVPKERVPALTVVAPVYVLAPVKIDLPTPAWVKVPVPEITALTVRSLEASRLRTSAALLVTEPEPSVPVAPPLPICKVPAVTVVMPL